MKKLIAAAALSLTLAACNSPTPSDVPAPQSSATAVPTSAPAPEPTVRKVYLGKVGDCHLYEISRNHTTYLVASGRGINGNGVACNIR